MHLFNEILIVLVALLIVAGIGLGLLIALAIFILGRQGNSPPATTATPPAVNQSKRIANCTVAMSVGSSALFFLAASLVHIQEHLVIAIILCILAIAAILYAWVTFQRI
jgi:hypothetical protein